MTALSPNHRPAFRVLVVDNDPFVHRKAQKELESLGDEVVLRHANSTEEAVELIRTEFFNAAFIDLILGKTRGSSVLRVLTANAPSCSVFVMSRRLRDQPEVGLEVLGMISPTFCPRGVNLRLVQ